MAVNAFMARPTFLQKVLRRPSKKYATTEPTIEPTHPGPQRAKNLYSTKEELLRIAAELNREGRTDVEKSFGFIQVSRDKRPGPRHTYIYLVHSRMKRILLR